MIKLYTWATGRRVSTNTMHIQMNTFAPVSTTWSKKWCAFIKSNKKGEDGPSFEPTFITRCCYLSLSFLKKSYNMYTATTNLLEVQSCQLQHAITLPYSTLQFQFQYCTGLLQQELWELLVLPGSSILISNRRGLTMYWGVTALSCKATKRYRTR